MNLYNQPENSLSQDALNEIVRLHGLWIEGKTEGVRASLNRASLNGASLNDANLIDASLIDASLIDASLIDASLSTKDGLTVPWHKADSSLPLRVATAAMQPNALDMSTWHTCETTHCLAGWAIALSGQTGAAIEALTSPSVAGSILLPSASHLFYSTNAEALEWCKAQLEAAK